MSNNKRGALRRVYCKHLISNKGEWIIVLLNSSNQLNDVDILVVHYKVAWLFCSSVLFYAVFTVLVFEVPSYFLSQTSNP